MKAAELKLRRVGMPKAEEDDALLARAADVPPFQVGAAFFWNLFILLQQKVATTTVSQN